MIGSLRTRDLIDTSEASTSLEKRLDRAKDEAKWLTRFKTVSVFHTRTVRNKSYHFSVARVAPRHSIDNSPSVARAEP